MHFSGTIFSCGLIRICISGPGTVYVELSNRRRESPPVFLTCLIFTSVLCGLSQWRGGSVSVNKILLSPAKCATPTAVAADKWREGDCVFNITFMFVYPQSLHNKINTQNRAPLKLLCWCRGRSLISLIKDQLITIRIVGVMRGENKTFVLITYYFYLPLEPFAQLHYIFRFGSRTICK